MTVPVRGIDVAAARSPLRLAVTLLMALAAGLSVANVYFSQPLLDAIGRDFALDETVLGLVMAVTQVGYGTGLILVAPLGDLIERRVLIVLQMVLTALVLTVIVVATNGAVFFMAMASLGALAVVAQVIVAHAASLAVSEERGRTVGTITTGIVIGILLARTISGALSDLFGWRAVYVASAIFGLVVSGLLGLVLPSQPVKNMRVSYFALIRGLLNLFVELKLLRVRGTLAFFTFFTVSGLSTPLVLPLSVEPYGLSHTQVGLFGLAGVAGALGASSAGRLADRGLGQRVTGVALVLMLASWLPIAALPFSLPLLAAGVVMIDFALQAVHVTNQGMIYRLRPDAQSRLAAAYMIYYAVGSSMGAFFSTMAYARYGWDGVCVLGATASGTAILFWALSRE